MPPHPSGSTPPHSPGSAPDAAQPSSAAKSGAASFPGRWKILVSVVVVVHLLAVVAEPMRFFSRSSRGTSPLVDPLRWSLAPYIEFAYLNHGYFFFAPEPGPSHLIECRLKFGDEEGRLRFPDRKAQWPRLLYHRHFMLAEFLNQLHEVPVMEDIVGDDPQLLAEWRANRQRYEMIRDSMARHLCERYGAEAATLDRLEHRLPSSVEVLVDQLPLDDPRFYLVLPDAPAIVPPGQPPIGIPAPPLPAGTPGRPGSANSAEVVSPTASPLADSKDSPSINKTPDNNTLDDNTPDNLETTKEQP